MRKIEIKEEANKKKRTNYIIMGIILIILLVFSSLGYSFLQNAGENTSENIIKEEGLTFARYGEYWKTIIQEKEFYFKYLPSEVKNISVLGIFNLAEYSNKPLYFVNLEYAEEILQNINPYILRYQEACVISENERDCADFPIKNCSEENVIIFTNKTRTGVWKEENCVYLSEDYTRSSDAFLYSMLQII